MKTRIIQDDQGGSKPPGDSGAGAPEPQRSRNFAHRVGTWSAHHWKTAVFGWLAFVVASVVLGNMVIAPKYLEATDANVGETQKADKIIEAGFPKKSEEQGEMVLIQHPTLTADDPAFKAVIVQAVETLESYPKVRKLNSPLEAGHSDLISDDRHSVMISFNPKGDYEEVITYIQTIEAGMNKVAKANPDFYVDELGASTNRELDVVFQGMIKTAGMIAIPIALVILLFVFGSVVAALVPLVLALTAVVATMSLVSLPSQFFPVDEQISEVILLIGLAVGIDYSLFYLKREREERAAGRSEGAALEAAAATSGRAVLISGITVIVAMGGMFLSGDKTFMSFSVGTMLVVLVAMIGSLTVLPALLSKLGDRVEKGRIPFLHRLQRKDGEGGRVWGAILDRVLKRPVISAVAATAVLVALALPALDIKTANPGIDDINIAEVEPIKKLIKAFPGGNDPARVAIQAEDVRAEPIQAAIVELEKRAIASGEMKQPIEVEASRDNTVAIVDIPLIGGGTDEVSKNALATLRDELLPATIGGVDGVEYAVGGTTAADQDWADGMKKSIPLVFGFVLLFAFLILLVSFRSIVVAFKAIVLNLLSVAAAYGLLVAVFQWGWGESLLGFESNGGIAPWLPVFLFVILFGLSMDYHVFILSKVRELYDRGYSNDEAVAHGIKSTAGVVTGAATVMVVTFGVFASLPVIDFKEMGIGLAAAILIDATIVRAVLLPATMKLLGDKNWYLPKWLEWLPHLEHGGSIEPAERVKTPPVAVPTA
jgi:uncharacterized membrane protein YdfJ with MMPL/SSD domain